MANEDPYEILGLSSSATEEEIKNRYFDLVYEWYEKKGSPEEFKKISSVHINLITSKRSLMIPDIGAEPRVLVKNPGWGSLMEKSISPVFMLGIIFTGLAGGLIGYSLQPKQTVVREIIREAQVQNAAPVPTPSPDREGPKEQSSISQAPIDRGPSKVAVATNPSPSSQKTSAPTNPNLVRPSTEQNIPNPSGTPKPFRIIPVPPQALPPLQQQPAGLPAGRPTLPAIPQSPTLLPLRPADRAELPLAKIPGQDPTQRSVPNISSTTAAPAKDEEADQLISKIDSYKSSQESPQATGVEPRKESNLATDSTSTVAKSSPEKILGTIPIPMEDGTAVTANKLLHLDTSYWKLDKGKTVKKVNVLVSELIISQNLNAACTKADISL